MVVVVAGIRESADLTYRTDFNRFENKYYVK